MAQTLAEKSCTPCQGGIPPLDAKDVKKLHAQVREWELRDDAHRIERRFKFRNFREALNFVIRIGALAEAEGHHPDINFGWGYVRVSLQTHAIGGLHENDFIMASKIDHAFAGEAAARAESRH